VIYELDISFVDGESNLQTTTNDIDSIYRALSKHDHEGSDIELSITANGEDAYNLIMMIREHMKNDNQSEK
jgi:hypothetical protein